MALIALATYCTPENQKAGMLQRTLRSLVETVDLLRHRVFVLNNNSTDPTTLWILNEFNQYFHIYHSEENLGTARGINKAWQHRSPGEHCIKMDDDVVIHNSGWADDMEYAIKCDPGIGIVGLKRKDCWERPDETESHKKSTLQMINPKGEKWCIVEKVQHVIGTCQMYNSDLLDKIGYLYQIGLYGYDDVLAAHRSNIAGFYNCFIPHIEIDHIDPGDTPYQRWKESVSGEGGCGPQIRQLIKDYHSGVKSIYHELY